MAKGTEEYVPDPIEKGLKLLFQYYYCLLKIDFEKKGITVSFTSNDYFRFS